MNLWVNRLRQLTFLSVALFFFSCEDESSFLGFKNPNDKFDLYSVEIPLESSVVWLDSVRTSNGYLPADVNRFLVGRYDDPVFGSVTSVAAGQYFRTSSTKLPAGAVFESAELWLAFDLYFYGSETPATQTYTVHMVESDMSATPRSKYVSKTPVTLSEPVGSITREINPTLIRELYVPPNTEDKPQPDTMKIPLSAAFHEPLWQKIQEWSYNNDSSYFKLTPFLETFRGLAIKGGDENSMIVGFNPLSFTQIVINYLDGTEKSRLVFRFDPGLISYNNIVSDYTGTPLEGIAYNTDFEPGNENRYLQTGTAVGTKILMDNFLAFADTVGPNVIINEVQLVVDNVEAHAEGQAPPVAFTLRAVKPDNTIWRLPEFAEANTADNDLFSAFRGLLTIDYQDPRGAFTGLYNSNFGALVVSDAGTAAIFDYDATDRQYVGYTTLFFQQLYRNRTNPQMESFLMFPTGPSRSAPSSLKGVNRAVFPASGIKLKVKYTKPTVVE